MAGVPVKFGRGSRPQASSTCWECDGPRALPVSVDLLLIKPGERILPLCESCYRNCYLPLAVEVLQDQLSAHR